MKRETASERRARATRARKALAERNTVEGAAMRRRLDQLARARQQANLSRAIRREQTVCSTCGVPVDRLVHILGHDDE